MAINRINTLQKLSYTGTSKDLQTYSDVYLKQALANLGQRFSVKGDGISVGKFSLYELFDGLPVPTEDDYADYGILYEAYMMGVVKPSSTGVEITLTACNIKDGASAYDKSIALSNADYVKAVEDAEMEGSKVKSVNGAAEICYYSKGGLVTKRDENYCTAFKTLSGSKAVLDISIDEYDSKNARIVDAIRLYELRGTTYATTINYDKDGLNGVSYYILRQYEIPNVGLDDLWEMGMDEESGPIMSNKQDWTPQDVIDALGLADCIGACKATFNAETQLFNVDSDTFENAFKSNTFIGDVVEANALEWNDSIALFLPFIKSYYNENVYFGSDANDQLKKRIVAEVLSELYDNFLKESDGTSIQDAEFRVYTPYEYDFIYTCNSNSPSQIFTSEKDLIVESVQSPEDELWKITRTGNNGVREQLLICDAWDDADSTEDIFSTWKYWVSYDKDNDVNEVTVERQYVLPYINDDGYWTINNVDTSIYARGKDGGQPSMIISYSDTSQGTRDILSTMNKDELTTALEWGVAYFKVRPLDTSSLGEATYHMMSTYMPVNISTSYLAENLVTFLENAIIMNIASVHNEVLSYSTSSTPLSYANALGENATVTTFWALKKDEETGKYDFTYVKQPDSQWAIDFNYLTDAESIVKYYMQLGIEPDLYKHSWVVFDGINSSLKNNDTPGSNKIAYPVIINRQRDAVSDIFAVGAAEGQYRNNLNWIPAFHTGIQMSGSYISGVNDENPEKFFKFDGSEGNFTIPSAQALGNGGAVNEWYPNSRETNTSGFIDSLLPVLDLKELFLRNMNALNRYNILSTNEQGNMYYAYIGTSYEDANKSVLHIGTGETNINLGTKTLTSEEERSKFRRHEELDVDFNTIVLNGDVVMPKASWSMTSMPGSIKYKMYSTQYDLAYVGTYPPTLADLSTAKSYPFCQIKRQVSSSIGDIGGGNSVSSKYTYVTYLNVNWLAQDILKVSGFTDTLLLKHAASVYGDAQKLTYVVSPSTVTYFLELTTDYKDASQFVRQVESTAPGGETTNIYFTKLNPLDVSYSADGSVQCRINIREIATTLSTAYSMYDGGELN